MSGYSQTFSFKVSHRFSHPVVFFTTGTIAFTVVFSGGASAAGSAEEGLGFLRGEVLLISSFKNAYPWRTESTSLASLTFCKATPAVVVAFRNVSLTFLYKTCCVEFSEFAEDGGSCEPEGSPDPADPDPADPDPDGLSVERNLADGATDPVFLSA